MDAGFNYYSGNSSSSSSLSSPASHSATRRRVRSHTHHRRRDCFLNLKVFRLKFIRYLLIIPILYFSGVFTCLGSLSALLYPTPLPGSVYRSHQIFQNLLTDILSDNSSGIQLSEVWRYKTMFKEQKPCLKPTSRQQVEGGIADYYLIVEANGGLNQQRASGQQLVSEHVNRSREEQVQGVIDWKADIKPPPPYLEKNQTTTPSAKSKQVKSKQASMAGKEGNKRDNASSITSVREQGNVLLQCPKLTETNYTTWALLMETILKAYGLWETIDVKDAVDEKKAYTSKAMIFQTLPEDVLMQVTQCSTTKEVWDSIKVRFIGVDLVQKARSQTLRSELESLKMKESETVSSFASKLSNMRAIVRNLGTTLESKIIVRKLLNSVRKKFLLIVATIEQYQDLDKMSFEEAVCNAVAVAGLLNATLLIPRFDFHKVWRDTRQVNQAAFSIFNLFTLLGLRKEYPRVGFVACTYYIFVLVGLVVSEFGDIYDEEHFIVTLKRYVDVVRELPKELMEDYDFNISNIPSLRVPAWASVSYYLQEVYPVLREQRIVRIAPFANRLASSLPPHIQYLRCLANYEALRFSIPIVTLARKLVNRMTADSSASGGKYVSVHLRFEEDMVAFSCCVYDGGISEQREMELIREKGWGDKFKRKEYVIAPDRNRINGRCPMTPLEVGMMLRGMGFANTTPIYLASAKIYQADKNLAPLRKLFPLLHTKELLASPNELASLKGYSSRMAALDYIVCFFSEVFVTTQGGNFPQFLMGHRKYHYGHAKTIQPDKRKLVVLLHNTSISWHALKTEMQVMLDESDHKSVAIPTIKKTKRKNSIFANPLPQCQCLRESKSSKEE
ncbi:hypothetical protein OSB04_031057 [Centaurea solstitialis]|uniref:O-fucosyltransferase family protein n=1 Tax=Centaurea solstitialis TaxID=347529 RepID=A0AA38W5L6_9ASTR|nr:hypothetical protein OSB04_031057 [Centaurea solstitialis]